MPARVTGRRLFVLVHRVSGLALAGFLTVVGVTGACLAWRMPLERVFAPHLFAPPRHAAGAQRVDALMTRERVAEAFPGARVDFADLSSPNEGPLEFFLTPGTSGAETDDDVFVDAYSGEVLGSRRYGDLRQGLKNVIPFVDDLHEQLALGGAGTVCLGVVALVWTMDCFVGMYLSFPASRQGAERLWPAFRIRWSCGGFRRLYDLHRASGVWLWLMLLVFAWSGVAFDLPVIYGAVMRVFGAEGETQARAGTACVAPDGAQDWGASLALARKTMSEAAEQRGFQVLSERSLAYEREECRWTYRVRSTLDVDRLGRTQVAWRDVSGGRPVLSTPTGVARADSFTSWIRAIHEARVGGVAVRVLVCLSGITAALLSITGVLVFLRKMGARRFSFGRRVET